MENLIYIQFDITRREIHILQTNEIYSRCVGIYCVFDYIVLTMLNN